MLKQIWVNVELKITAVNSVLDNLKSKTKCGYLLVFIGQDLKSEVKSEFWELKNNMEFNKHSVDRCKSLSLEAFGFSNAQMLSGPYELC